MLCSSIRLWVAMWVRDCLNVLWKILQRGTLQAPWYEWVRVGVSAFSLASFLPVHISNNWFVVVVVVFLLLMMLSWIWWYCRVWCRHTCLYLRVCLCVVWPKVERGRNVQNDVTSSDTHHCLFTNVVKTVDIYPKLYLRRSWQQERKNRKKNRYKC